MPKPYRVWGCLLRDMLWVIVGAEGTREALSKAWPPQAWSVNVTQKLKSSPALPKLVCSPYKSPLSWDPEPNQAWRKFPSQVRLLPALRDEFGGPAGTTCPPAPGEFHNPQKSG